MPKRKLRATYEDRRKEVEGGWRKRKRHILEELLPEGEEWRRDEEGLTFKGWGREGRTIWCGEGKSERKEEDKRGNEKNEREDTQRGRGEKKEWQEAKERDREERREGDTCRETVDAKGKEIKRKRRDWRYKREGRGGKKERKKTQKGGRQTEAKGEIEDPKEKKRTESRKETQKGKR